MTDNRLPKLELPKRWEFLERRALELQLRPSEFVERVDDAAKRIDYLLQRVATGGGGLFEVLFGKSGSGKTTFLKTLPSYFEGLKVISYPKERSILELPDFIRRMYVHGEEAQRIILIERRDNPPQAEYQNIDEMFSELLEVFREPEGAVLVIWPMTKEVAADHISAAAWNAGRDSMTDSVTKGKYKFLGVSSTKYYEIADNTTKNLTGDPLEAFGITKEIGNDLIRDSETIADFFSKVDVASESQRSKTWSILKERSRARLWIVLPGDVPTIVNNTVTSLTQGTRNRLDLDLVAEFIDNPNNDSIYIKDWKQRRAAMAHLLRAIDVRLFQLPPNVSLAAIRACGSDAVKNLLKQKSISTEEALSAMRASRLYKAILSEIGVETSPFSAATRDVPETSNEYRRVQATASKGDKDLNKALGGLIEKCLEVDEPHAMVRNERQSIPNCELKPDTSIELAPGDYICIEPTWRSSDKGIPGEIDGGQNTLAPAHVKKYVLEKAMQYIKALDL
jgi:hypothetical protein